MVGRQPIAAGGTGMPQRTVPSPVDSTGDSCTAAFVAVHHLVERAAAAAPSAVAIRHREEKLTRGALLDRARRLASYLLDRGVAPGSVVAVRLDRSIDHIVTWLAILQSGSAFMSIDPADPIDRVRRLIDATGAVAVITDSARVSDHPGLAIRVDDPAIAGAVPRDLPAVEGGDLAYVAHTSGSTGEPNGVEITHANLVHLVAWVHDTFAITADDRVSLALGLGFDAAIWELWPALAAGAAVHVIDDITRTAPDLLRAQWLEECITLATVPTALVEPLIAADWPADAPLRYLFTGGDVLRVYPRENLPFQLVNNYGPTECTCETTWAVVPPGPAQGAGLPPIGRPIAGVVVHILDDTQRPVAPGIEGEIWIGGRSVGRGYRNKPELTAARFRADPFARDAGARMYRTGDRGRLLDSGEIAFSGRVDRQVKIAGVRIELDEIVVALQAHPDVATAIVTVHDDAGDGASLVAHIVPATPGHAPEALALRRFLYRRVPRSHIPSAFVVIGAVPLTGNGKIDHAALPAPERMVSSPLDLDRLEAPQRKVIEIIRDVLGHDAVSLDDNFFLLGGHSLQATQVVLRCRETFGVRIPLADLFGADTIAEFIDAIRDRVARWVATLSDRDVRTALGKTG
jgi:amino acid adenylation domain-containing protein